VAEVLAGDPADVAARLRTEVGEDRGGPVSSGPRRGTSGRAMRSRSSSRSARSVRPRSLRSRSTARSAASTPPRTTSCSSWTASRSSARPRRRS
jgi:hypothetical protein